MNYDDFDDTHHPRPQAVDSAGLHCRPCTRRQLLHTGASLGAALLALVSGAAPARRATAADAAPLLGFEPVAATGADTVSLPPGYRWQRVVSRGDALARSAASERALPQRSAAELAFAFGDNNDGMELFALDADRALLAVNNEYINRWHYYRDPEDPSAADVERGQLAHGISLFEIHRRDGEWRLALDAPRNRRIHAQTPMAFSGPAAGHPLLQTGADPGGKTSLGTWANCGSGQTPWGTYLTCEENFNAYFGSAQAVQPTAEQRRYGLSERDWGLGWYKHQPRFDIAREPHEPHRVGWVVEVDPHDPESTPRKHTALGRFKHENAEICLTTDNRVVVYMGDDERGEFLYRFVAIRPYRPGEHAHNRDILASGRLYAAQFDNAGTGRWLELSPGKNGLSATNGFADPARVAVFTRLAASIAGATTMDRPEWVASHPDKAELYCALSNNKYRGRKPNAGGDPQPAQGPNPRADNHYGQILRWRPSGGDHLAETFNWDLFALAGNPAVHAEGPKRGSANIDAGNLFNAPDGMAVDRRGVLWIQTDGDVSDAGDFAGMGNNQMLAADPATGEIRRFMVGPRGCEVTGLCWSPDGTTAFVGIQHPGDNHTNSSFPDGPGNPPRSSVIAISRRDGGAIGT